MGDRAAEGERQAHAILTARLRARARVELLASLAREAEWALALELRGAQLNALGAIQAWVRFAEDRQVSGQVAKTQVWVEDGVLRAVHEEDLAQLAANDVLGLFDWVWDLVAWLSSGADIVASASLLLLLLLDNWLLLLEDWLLWADLGGNSANVHCWLGNLGNLIGADGHPAHTGQRDTGNARRQIGHVRTTRQPDRL